MKRGQEIRARKKLSRFELQQAFHASEPSVGSILRFFLSMLFKCCCIFSRVLCGGWTEGPLKAQLNAGIAAFHC
jgi:hypothetical protein